MKINQFLLLLAFATPSLVNASGIPVVDLNAAQQRASNHLKQMAEMAKQLSEMKAQLDQAKMQYKSLTGTRNLGDLLNNPLLASHLPKEWQQVHESIRKGGYRGLDGTAKALADASKLISHCTYLKSVVEKQNCEAQAVQSAQVKSDLTKAFDAALKRLEQIEGLMKHINLTQDPKAIAELQARIQAEQAKIQNESVRMQMYALMQEQNQKLLVQEATQRRHDALMNYKPRY